MQTKKNIIKTKINFKTRTQLEIIQEQLKLIIIKTRRAQKQKFHRFKANQNKNHTQFICLFVYASSLKTHNLIFIAIVIIIVTIII